MNYFADAFKRLSLLEGAYNLYDKKDVDELNDDIIEDDTNNEVDVIDVDADNKSELKRTYVGKAILQCTVCHALKYCDIDEVHFYDDDQNEDPLNRVVNRDEECPNCMSTEGFNPCGKVAPFTSDDLKVSYELDDDEDNEVEADVELKATVGEDPEEEEEEVEEETEDTEEDEDIEEDEEEDKEDELEESLDKDLLESAPLKITDEQRARIMDWVNRTGYKAESLSSRVYFPSEQTEEISDSFEKKGCCGKEQLHEDDDWELEEDFDKANCVGCRRKKVQEGFNNVDVTTDDQRLTMEQDPDTKKVTVTTEPIDQNGFDDMESGEGEMAAPLTDMDVENMEAASDAENMGNEEEAAEEGEEPVEVEAEEGAEETEGEEVEVNPEEFANESFDYLGKKYLKNVYENVNTFKTTSVREGKNGIIIEGVIGFKSGSQKKTQFVFEAKSATRDGRLRFIGENKGIASGKKAFVMTGRVDKSNTLIAESLSYNYSQNKNKVNGTVYTRKDR